MFSSGVFSTTTSGLLLELDTCLLLLLVLFDGVHSLDSKTLSLSSLTHSLSAKLLNLLHVLISLRSSFLALAAFCG